MEVISGKERLTANSRYSLRQNSQIQPVLFVALEVSIQCHELDPMADGEGKSDIGIIERDQGAGDPHGAGFLVR